MCVDSVQLRRLDERGDRCPVLATTVRAGKERVLAIEGDRPDIAPDGVGIVIDPANLKAEREAIPAREGIAEVLCQSAPLIDERQLGS